MLLFVANAVLVWYGAFSGRRRLGGLAATAAGLFLLFIVNRVHYDVARAFGYEQLVPVFRVLLYPYIVLVGSVGIFLVMLPIDLPRGDLHCLACRYDLSDLREEVESGSPCPECGATLAEAKTRRGRRIARKRRHAMSRCPQETLPGIRLASPEGEAGDGAGDQHQHRQPA